MRAFSLHQNPLDVAHAYWNRLLMPGDTAIDATCGNGRDTLVIAKAVLGNGQGRVIAIDRQEKAIESAQKHLRENLPANALERIGFYLQCHTAFPEEANKNTIALVAYNLGYLPGGDKNLTTETSTTLQSLRAALSLIRPGGVISIMCYPGHPEGEKEQETLIPFAAALDQKEWSCCHHRWVNRKASPTLLLIQRAT